MPDPAAPEHFYLIDGHAQIFRAYYAIREGMSSPVTGEPTHAVHAFAGMLLKLFEQYRPSYVAMAIDLPGKTFRDEIYEDYKANREPPPDDFHPQEQRIFEMTKMFGIPILSAAGAEADDVIATCTRRVLEAEACRGVDVRIVSRDKDLEQLLGARVCLFDIHKDETVDVATLERAKGIKPEQVADVLALMGDNVDNIPGVEGIGPKTAAKLIAQFGNIEGVLANLEKIKGKRRANIEAAADRLSLNQKLVALKADVPIDFDIQKARAGGMDRAGLGNLFETLGLRRCKQDLDRLAAGRAESPPRGPAGAGEGFEESLFGAAYESNLASTVDDGIVAEDLDDASSCDYSAVTSADELEQLVRSLESADIVSVDTETIGLGSRAELCGLSFAWRSGHGVYVPVASAKPQDHLDKATVLDRLRTILENAQLRKCGHNLKYDALVLRHAGICLRGIAFDSMIASQLLGLRAHGLDHLARVELGHAMIPISRIIGGPETTQKTIDEVQFEQVTDYAAEDADMALRLYEKFGPRLDEAAMRGLAEVEMPLVEVLADMEANGIRVDGEELLRQGEQLAGRIDILRDKIFEAAGEPFNLDSPKQLADVLFNKLGLPVVKRKKTGPSTDVEVLERLAAREDLDARKTRVPTLIVEYRQFSKLVNTYLGNLRRSIRKEDGRIHASFVQLGAATGRLSSGGPNLQNIPVRTDVGRQVRKAFIAEPRCALICADYSQIELRILAHLSHDPALTEAFLHGVDIHAAVAAEVFGVEPAEVTADQRATAKVVNFGIIYGITAFGLTRRIESLDEKAARKLIADYRRRFAGIDVFMHECVAEAQKHGYVTTMLGRRRRIEQINSRNAQTRALGERLAINTVVQGSATGDLIKTAMVNLARRVDREKLPMKMLVQIHDELIFEAPADVVEQQAQIVREEMEGAMKLSVPLVVDVGIGADWYSAKG
jgi:DNA polymerase-1